MQKNQRLCSVKDIESLFREGKAFLVYPVRCVFKWAEAATESEKRDNLSDAAQENLPDTGITPDEQATTAARSASMPTGHGSTVLCRVMVAAPKKNHKRAVKRNLLKRRLRESFRLNRQALMETLEQLAIERSSASSYAPDLLRSGELIEPQHDCIAEKQIPELHLSLSYVAKEELPYGVIEDSVKKCLERIITKIGNPAVGGTD